MSSDTRSGGHSRRDLLGYVGAGFGAAALNGSACQSPYERCAGVPPATSSSALLANIDTFVVVMMENRSFDQLLGGLRADRRYPMVGRIDGLTGNESNVDAEGREVQIAPLAGDGSGSLNPKHDAVSCRAAFNDGHNDGFLRANTSPLQLEVMSYLDRDQAPLHMALADRFTVCDRWFSSFMGPTWPNRFYLHAGTSGGRQTNWPMGFDAPPTIWERMALQCRSAKNYRAGSVLWYAAAFPANAASGNDAMVSAPIEDFFRDARAGNLSEFTLIDPDWKYGDGSPRHHFPIAEGFVSSIVKAIADGPQWKRSLTVVIYDEHGGYYDHVAPPTTVDPRAGFRQLGFRVPAIVIGPSVWQGGVVSTPFEHVSIAATLKTRFGITSLGPRMDATNDLSSCIDPALAAAPALAPVALPVIELDAGATLRQAIRNSSQLELEQAVAAGGVPSDHVDVRSADERFKSWLRYAQELEAVKVTG